jgi:hypothetical protein
LIKLSAEEIEVIDREVDEAYQKAEAHVKAVSARLNALSAEQVANKGGYKSGGYTNHNPDPLSAWLFSERQLTFAERCYVGFRLWFDGVSKSPWPVKQVRK